MSPRTESGSGRLAASEACVVFEYLKSSGGGNNMAVDGSVVPVFFGYEPPAGKGFIAGRVILSLKGNVNFDYEKFGHIAKLIKGVSVMQNGIEINNWKCNRDMMLTFYDWKFVHSFDEKSLLGRWSFFNITGETDGLEIRRGGNFGFKIQDDLADEQLEFYAMIQGKLVE